MKNKQKKLLTVNVAIAAYNAEKNIARMITSLLKQEVKDYTLNKIIINSDCGTDDTVKIAKTFKHPKLKIIDSKTRQGFAKVLMNLFSVDDADIFILLNDDIIIKDEQFINNIVNKFYSTKNVGLVCANIQPLPPCNFVSKAVNIGFNAFKRFGESIKKGDNAYTCDGKVLCFSASFIKSIKSSINLNEIGNVDRYLYLLCIKNGFNYKYAFDAIIYFKFPSNLRDFIKWQIRNYRNSNLINNSSIKILAKKELNKSFLVLNYFKIIEFIKNPVHALFILLIGIYCSLVAGRGTSYFNAKWEVIESTKEL